MYMYYFLGFRLWAQENDARRKQIQADNTFLLALDGDVDFQPKAVQVFFYIYALGLWHLKSKNNLCSIAWTWWLCRI